MGKISIPIGIELSDQCCDSIGEIFYFINDWNYLQIL